MKTSIKESFLKKILPKRENKIKDNDKKKKQVVHGNLGDEDKKNENVAKKGMHNFGENLDGEKKNDIKSNYNKRETVV